jgi:hypothetical protein
MTLSATTTGYARASGSFITDGFAVGQEITTAGFDANAVAVITALSATAMRIDTTIAAESAASGRSIRALLPVGRALENVKFDPSPDRPWIQEQYVPATTTRRTTASNGGHADETGFYIVTYYGLAGKGSAAILRVTDAIVALFTSGTTVTDGTNAIEVTGFPGPNGGQVIEQDDGYARRVVEIPWRAHTRIAVLA